MTNEKTSYLFELDGAWMSSSSSFSSAGSNNTDNLNRLVELTQTFDLDVSCEQHKWCFLTGRVNAVCIRVDEVNCDSEVRLSQEIMLVLFLQRSGLVLNKPSPKKKQQKKTFGYFSLKHQVVCIMLKLLARFMELEEQLIYVLLPLVSSICCVGLMLASFGIHTYKGSFILNLC